MSKAAPLPSWREILPVPDLPRKPAIDVRDSEVPPGNTGRSSAEAATQDRINWFANLLFFIGLFVYYIYYVSEKDQTVCCTSRDGKVESR